MKTRHSHSHPMSVLHFTLQAGAAIWLLGWLCSPALPAADVVITSLSPDGHFALRTGNREPGQSELIALPKDDADAEWGPVLELKHSQGDTPISHLYWSPDSRRFAFADSETQRFTATVVYERAKEEFRKVKLPDIPLEEPDAPKGWTFREKGDSVIPRHWQDPGTLVLKTWVYGYLTNKAKDDGDSGESEGLVRLRFSKAEDVAKPKVISHGKPERLNSSALRPLKEQPQLRELLALDASLLDVQWMPDKSAALIVQGNSGASCQAAQIVELRKGKVTRITDLRQKLDAEETKYFLQHNPGGEAPDLSLQFEEWRRVGSDRIEVERQVATESPADAKTAWGARIDAVWDIAKARWTQLQIKHYHFPLGKEP
jgi:hypothetical protein